MIVNLKAHTGRVIRTWYLFTILTDYQLQFTQKTKKNHYHEHYTHEAKDSGARDVIKYTRALRKQYKKQFNREVQKMFFFSHR